MSQALRQGLMSFRTTLEKRQQARRESRIAKGRAEHDIPVTTNPTAPLVLSPDVKAFFDRVMAAVEHDRDRYFPAPEAIAADAAGPAAEAEAKPVAVAAAGPSIHLQSLWSGWDKVETLLTPDAQDAALTPAVAYCAGFLRREVAQLIDENGQRTTMAPGVLNKVRQAVQAYVEQRTNDAVTLLKNVLHNDPHNHVVLALLSQIMYQMAAKGTQTMLPEAREHAQRSIIASEKVKPERLALYRYMAIVTERAFGPERVVDWLRDTGLLQAEVLCGPKGLLAESGIHLRAWAILSTIPVETWHEQHFDAVRDLVLHVIGGAAIYVAWLRGPLVQAAANSKTPMPLVEELERLVRTTQMNHAEVNGAMHQLPLRTSDKPWMVRVRFLHAVVQVAPLPTFDQTLCQIALDGQNWVEGVSPDPELFAMLGSTEMSYWRLWALSLTPFKDVRQPYLLPAEETVADGELLNQCDALLAALRDAEKVRIKPHLWEDLKPWMVRWQTDHLLAAGTGSNKPRSRFAPSLPPYIQLYRAWQEPTPTGRLASEIITENAKRGAFSGLFEILGAFEGANRLLDDPVHGLVASQKAALMAANKQNPKKFRTVATEFGGVSGSGMMMAMLPVGLMGLVAAVFTFSANWGQALGLLLALGGVGGVIVLNLKK